LYALLDAVPRLNNAHRLLGLTVLDAIFAFARVSGTLT